MCPLEKHPSESIAYTVDLTQALDAGEAAIDVSPIDVVPQGLDVTAGIINLQALEFNDGQTAAPGKAIQFIASGGVEALYTLGVKYRTNAGNDREARVQLRVTEFVAGC